MPANTLDQQITYPIGTDPADNPTAFLDMLADVEPRLVRQYTNEADRTTRLTAPQEGALTSLAAENRYDTYEGTGYISTFTRSLFAAVARTTDSANITNNTLVTDAVLTVPLPTAGRFEWEAVFFYDASTTADFKFAMTWPAGVTNPRWGIQGLATGATLTTGDGQFATSITSAAALAVGAAGVGTGNTVMALASGVLTMGGTAGNLVVSYAQNTTDASNAVCRSGSRLHVWKVAV